MKIKFLSLFILGAELFSPSASAISIEALGYLRSGVGTNSKGGNQECFNNPGSSGNEFRLGNECGTYGELGFNVHHMPIKKSSKKLPFFRTQIRLAFAPKGHTNWEGANGTNPIAVRETYIEGGGFSGRPYSYWVGKRFYRGNDIYMTDFYYIFDMSGNGGGIGDIPFFKEGKLAFAWMREVSTTDSDIGLLGLTVFDARVKDFKVNEKFKIDFWLAYGQSPSATDTLTSKSYDDSSGFLAGALFKKELEGGFNHLAIIFGTGVMHNFNLYGSTGLEVGSAAHIEQDKSQNIRIIEHLTLDLTNNLTTHFSTSMELRDNGKTYNDKETWWNIGIHPVYYFDDHFQLTGVIGTSVVDADGAESKTLSRFTIAPQISMSRNIWSRPVLRAFYTYSTWSKSNKGVIGGTTYKNDTSGSSYGLQGEVWF